MDDEYTLSVGFSCLAGLLIIMLLMTASTIRETIRNWRDHHAQSQDR